MKRIAYIEDTPAGALTLCEENGAITGLWFGKQPLQQDMSEETTPPLEEAIAQLKEYFAGERREFTVKLNPAGTDFQKKVWDALCEIPFGQTCTYGEIADKIGCPKGSRAVGLANNKNPIAVIIPCHRVIGANGKLTGYAGGLETKEALLKLEGSL